jgi:lipopolysaccharide export system protein LptA
MPKPPVAGPAVAARKSKPKGQDQASGDLDVNLKFKKIDAQGKTVQLLSEANDVHAEMRELDYDQTTREAILTAAPKSVQAYQKANHLHAPRITLKQSESGNDVTDIRCIGQGGLEHHDDKTKEVDLIAEWRKEMHKYPDPVPKSTFDLVDFEEAVIWQPKEPASEALGIAANHLRVWVKRQQADRQAIAANRPLSTASPQNGPQIDHLLALQNVAVVSPQLEAETEHLEIWFEAGSLPGGGLPGSKKPIPAKRGAEKAERERRPRTHLLPTAGRVENKDSAVMPLFASPVNVNPGGVNPNGVSPNGTPGAGKPNRKAPANSADPGKSKKPGGPPAEPYRINAAKINVRVLQGKAGEQPQVAEVVSQGNVHLTQPHGEDAEALAIDGNDLHVENHGGMDQDMVVLGQPAHVRNQGAHIEGNQIRFNRLKNAADVDGLGKMQLPLKSSKPADETADDEDKPALPLDVDWHNGMHFDGRTATFDGMVRSTIDDGQAKSEIRCRDMQVTLTKRFSFTEERRPGDQPEIDTIVCRGGVEFESDSTTNPKLMEIRRGQFVQLVMHRATGKAEGIGPGVLHVWRRGEHGNSGLGAISSARSNAPPKERKSTSWQFIQVTFNGHMDGDFSHLLTPGQTSQVLKTVAKTQSDAASNPLMNPKGQWTTTFHDHVQVLYGPVDQPMDIIIRDELQEGCGWLGCDHLEIAQQAQSATADQHMTLVSRGDAKIEGKSFNGEAETITYDGSTGLYVLHGGEDGYATLYRQLKVGGPLSKSMQGVLRFKPDTNTISADQAVDIDAINGPAPPKKNDAKSDKTPKARKKSRFGR